MTAKITSSNFWVRKNTTNEANNNFPKPLLFIFLLSALPVVNNKKYGKCFGVRDSFILKFPIKTGNHPEGFAHCVYV